MVNWLAHDNRDMSTRPQDARESPPVQYNSGTCRVVVEISVEKSRLIRPGPVVAFVSGAARLPLHVRQRRSGA